MKNFFRRSYMKVLLINGSAKKNGCTYTALAEVEKSLNAEGCWNRNLLARCRCSPWLYWLRTVQYKAERLYFRRWLHQWDYCKSRKRRWIYLGTPVYYAHPSGRILSALDRMFMPENPHLHISRELLWHLQDGQEQRASVDVLNKYFTISEMPVVSSSYWNMVHGNKPEEVLQDEEGLQIMRNLGRNMAWILKCIDAGKQKGIVCPQNEYTHKTNFIR